MVLLRSPWLNSSGAWANRSRTADEPAERIEEPGADQEYVDERRRAEQRVPEAQAEFVVPAASRRGSATATIQNLSGGFSRNGPSARARSFAAPASRRSRPCGRRRTNRWLRRCRDQCVPRPTNSGRQKKTRTAASQRQPAGARRPRLFLDASDERPDPRDVHLLDRDRLELGLREERRAGRDPT